MRYPHQDYKQHFIYETRQLLQGIKKDLGLLIEVGPALRDDLWFMSEAIRAQSDSLDYASRRLQLRKKLNYLALEHGHNLFLMPMPLTEEEKTGLSTIPEGQKNNREYVLQRLSKNGGLLRCVSPQLLQDYEVVLTAVKRDGMALEYASDALRNNETIVLEAVRQDGWALQYASAALRGNESIVLEAVRQKGWALQYASDALRNNEALVREAVKQNGEALQYASETLRKESPIVLKAISQESFAFYYADESLKDSQEVVLAAVSVNGWLLEYASAALKKEPVVVLTALREDREALRFVDESFAQEPLLQLYVQEKISYKDAMSVFSWLPEQSQALKEEVNVAATALLNGAMDRSAFEEQIHSCLSAQALPSNAQ